MYIRWQQRKRTTPQFGPHRKQVGKRKAGAVARHPLVCGRGREQAHRRQADAAPYRLHHRLHRERRQDYSPQRCYLWDHICERLDQLGNQITAADRERIEAAIAEKVPRPTPTEYKDSARSKAQNIGWKWLSAKQKAVLQDESEE